MAGNIEIGRQQRPQRPGKALQLSLHPLIEMLENLGREHQNGHPLFFDAPQDGFGLQSIQIGDFHPGKKGQQQSGRKREGVVQGQDGEKIIIRPDGVELGDAPIIGAKILMGKHHPFGKPGGARGIDDGGQVVGGDRRQAGLTAG